MVMSEAGVKMNLDAIERHAIFYHKTGNEKFFKSVQSEKKAIVKSHKDLEEVYQDRVDDIDFYLKVLREIDTHIRSTSEPIPHIIETLKVTLPEYQNDFD